MKKKIIVSMIIVVMSLTMPLGMGIQIIPTENTEISQAVSYGKQQALKQAKEYVRVSGISKKFLIEMLIDDGYTKSEAKYGAAHCKANWMKQATRCARQYLKVSAMSRSELYEFLRDDGFTKKQANHAVKVVYK